MKPLKRMETFFENFEKNNILQKKNENFERMQHVRKCKFSNKKRKLWKNKNDVHVLNPWELVIVVFEK